MNKIQFSWIIYLKIGRSQTCLASICKATTLLLQVELTGRELGTCAFDRVLEGHIKGVSVAVKDIRTTSEAKVDAFFRETYAHLATKKLSGIVAFKGKP